MRNDFLRNMRFSREVPSYREGLGSDGTTPLNYPHPLLVLADSEDRVSEHTKETYEVSSDPYTIHDYIKIEQ